MLYKNIPFCFRESAESFHVRIIYSALKIKAEKIPKVGNVTAKLDFTERTDEEGKRNKNCLLAIEMQNWLDKCN